MTYKEEFIKFMVDSGVLTFGDFTLKSGRKAPYFINCGNYKTGEQLAKLGGFYADCIADNKIPVETLFGPAYKGIPLAVSAVIALATKYGIDVSYCFDRKEAKDHGEGGMFVGKKLADGEKVIIIDDVMTSGKALRESMSKLKSAADVNVTGMVITVDRMEKALDTDLSAVEQAYKDFGVKVYSIVNINDIIKAIQDGVVEGKEYLDKMLEALTDVESTKTIENPENLDQYGLEIPVCVITVEDGQSHTLSIGLETAVGGQRYFSNGDGNVYLVDGDIIEHFQYGLYDILKHQTLPEVAQLTGLTVALPGGGYEITREENSGLAYSDDYVWFMDGKALDNDLTQTLLDMVTNLNLSECVDYNATDLSRYGLDAPAVTATVLDGGKAAYTLEISASENGECYVRLSDSKMIYQRDAALSDTLRYTTYADLQPDDVILMDWDTVQSVAVTLDGEEYLLTRTTEEKTDGEGTVETVWKLDGQDVAFASVLNSLSDMTSNGYATGIAPEGEPEITFRFFRDRDSFSQVTLSFYAYNSTSCLVTLDGVSTVTVKRETAAELVSSVKNILK